MIIGSPKEIKNNENRVSMTPAGAYSLIKAGHSVLVEKSAGEGSGFSDEEYLEVGAKILSKDEVFAKADLIVKVKEYLPSEYHYLRKEQLVFTYLHIAANKEFADALIASKTTAIAYETVTDNKGNLSVYLFNHVKNTRINLIFAKIISSGCGAFHSGNEFISSEKSIS